MGNNKSKSGDFCFKGGKTAATSGEEGGKWGSTKNKL